MGVFSVAGGRIVEDEKDKQMIGFTAVRPDHRVVGWRGVGLN
jgi:hypothetical protein